MNTPIEKNKQYIVDIIDNGFEGEGIAKVSNFTIFVPGAIKGEKVKIHIVKVLSSHAFGKILDIIEPSIHRVILDCDTYSKCGGCNLRHIDYEETLKIKQNMLQALVNKTLKDKVLVNKTLGMGNPFRYRNKAQYPLGISKDGKPTIGVYARRSHEIIPMNKCAIQNNMSEEISKFIFEFVKEKSIPVYNEKTGSGILRHIVIKVGIQTNEVMCILVMNKERLPNEEELIEKLINRFPCIKTIVKNINTKNTNVILGEKNIIIYGTGYIYDILGEYKFKISPMSFYQINPIQTEALYNMAIEMAKLDKEETKIAFDLYCGIGTIGIFISKYVEKVYGIEIVEQAIKDANENVKINNVNNAEFMVGDVEFTLSELIYRRKIKPDIIFVDPPRKGLDNTTIENLLKIKAKKIVYISCNPATFVRDLSKMEELYKVSNINTVDMFPFTSHVECCSVMYLKDLIQ